MTAPQGFKAIEKRIEELIEQTGDVSPFEVMMLLRRADSNPGFDLMQEIDRLRKKANGTSD